MLTIVQKIPRHLLVAASAWFGRLSAALMGLYTIRLLTVALGTEHYAVFALLSGLQGWYLLADFGLGASLQNFISERRARHESYGDLVGMAGVLAILLAVILLATLYAVARYVAPLVLQGFPWLTTMDQVRDFYAAGALCTIFGIGGISYKIWYAEQRGYLANLMPALAATITLVWVQFVAQMDSPDKLFWCLIAAFLPQSVLPTCAFVVQLVGTGQMSLPDLKSLRNLLKRAFKFWGFGIMAALVLQIDYLVMSQFLSPRDIVAYSLAAKMFGLAFFVYSAVLQALWPACAEMVELKKWEILNRILVRNILIGIAIIVTSTLVLLLAMDQVVEILSPNDKITISSEFLILCGIYYVIRVWTDTYGMILQSASYLRPFWILTPIQAIVSVVTMLLLTPIFGINGVVYSLCLSFILTVAWGLPFAWSRRRNKLALLNN